MPRKKLQKEVCDCAECRNVFPADSIVGTAVSRQQPPPKCLIIHAASCLNVVEQPSAGCAIDSVSCPHIDAVIQAGCSGLLAIRRERGKPNSEQQCITPVKATEHSQELLPEKPLILHNLLCSKAVEKTAGNSQEEASFLRELVSEFATNSSGPSEEWATSIGFRNFHSLPSSRDFDIKAITSLIAKQIGLQSVSLHVQQGSAEGPTEGEAADLFFLYLSSNQSSSAENKKPAPDRGGGSTAENEISEYRKGGPKRASLLSVRDIQQLEAIESLLQAFNAYQGFRDRVLLVILLEISDFSGNAILSNGSGPLQDLIDGTGYEGITKPRQSFEFAHMNEADLDASNALLCIQRLPYVIRKDEECQLPSTLEGYRPGNGCMLAERLLPEIAYKLGRAPKYGA